MGVSKGRKTATHGTGPQGHTAKTDQLEIDQEAFLQAFAMLGSIPKAAEALRAAQGRRMETQDDRRNARDIHYRWLREDPGYRERYEQARAEFADVIETEVLRRAIEGDDEYIVSAGKLVYIDNDPAQGALMQRKRSDRLLELAAKAHIDRYGDRQRIEHSGSITTIQGLLSGVPADESPA